MVQWRLALTIRAAVLLAFNVGCWPRLRDSIPEFERHTCMQTKLLDKPLSNYDLYEKYKSSGADDTTRLKPMMVL